MADTTETTQPITISYEQNFNDWKSALQTVGLIGSRPYVPIVVAAIVAAILAAIARHEHSLIVSSALLVITLLLIAAASQAKAYIARRLQRNWNASRLINLPITVTFSDDQVSISTHLTQTTMQWPVFLKYTETDTLFIIIVGTGNILALPKAGISQDSAIQLRQMLNTRMNNHA